MVTAEELSWIVTQLGDLSAFLETNSAVVGGAGLHHHHPHPHHQQQHQDALLRERQSLLFLQQLASHCRQVLSLWGVVCDHQCHVVVRALSPDDRNVLRGMYFRDLILST
jgi:nuclear pore complex protein Nup155